MSPSTHVAVLHPSVFVVCSDILFVYHRDLKCTIYCILFISSLASMEHKVKVLTNDVSSVLPSFGTGHLGFEAASTNPFFEVLPGLDLFCSGSVCHIFFLSLYVWLRQEPIGGDPGNKRQREINPSVAMVLEDKDMRSGTLVRQRKRGEKTQTSSPGGTITLFVRHDFRYAGGS